MNLLKTIVAACVLIGVTWSPVRAVTNYWDIDTIDQAGAGGATPAGTWDTGTTANWNTNATGTGIPGTWTAGDSAVFAAGTDATGSYLVTVSGTQSVGALTVEEGTVQLGTGQVDFGGTNGGLTINNGATLNMVGAGATLNGTSGITKSGAGTLLLGNAAQPFSKATGAILTISSGVVEFTATGSTAGNDNALGANPATAQAAALTINGGTLRWNGTAAHTLSLNRGITIGANGGTIEVVPTTNTGLSLPSAAAFTLNGSGTLTKTGAGRFTLNTTSNSFTGKYIVKAGTLSSAGDGRFGLIPVAVTPDYFTLDGGALRNSVTSGSTWNSNRGITLLAGGGTLYQPGAGTATDSLTYNGIIAGTAGGNLTIGSTGPEGGGSTDGIVILGGANTYDGQTSINAGMTLRLGAAGVIPDSSVVNMTASGAIFDLGTNSISETVKSIAGTGGTVAVGAGTLTVNNPAGETYSSVFTATAGGKVIKNGAGTWILSGGSTGFNGEFDLNSGTLGVGGSNIFGNASNTSSVVINGGKLSNTGTGGRTIAAPIPVALNADILVDDSLFSTSAPGQILFNGPATMNANRIITVNGLANLGLADLRESGGARTLTKAGSGTLALTGTTASDPNAFTGSVTVNAGRLQVTGASFVGNGTNTINLNGGALNTSATRTVSLDNPINVTADSAITTTSTASTPNFDFGNNNPVSGTGKLTLRNDGGDAATDQFRVRFFGQNFTVSNNIDMPTGSAGSSTELSSFNTTGGTQTFSGVISGTGDFKRSASTGGTGGTTIFTAQNTFTGGTQLNDGTIEFDVNSVGSPGALTSGPVGTGTITVNNTNAPKLAAGGGARNVANAIAFAAGSTMGISGSNDLTLAGDVSLGTVVRTLDVSNSGLSVMSGLVSGTAGAGLVKSNTGTLKLTGENTYDGTAPSSGTFGTLVSAGKLLVSNTGPGSGTGTGTVSVAVGAILGGTGRIGGAVTNDGTIAPGESIGTLNVNGNVTMDDNSHLAIELAGGGSSDLLAITGDLNLSSLLDNLDLSGSGAGPWTIAAYTGNLTGTFNTVSGLPLGYSVDYGTGSNSQIKLVSAGLAGDYNNDGKVDAADYVAWRKNPAGNGGDPAGYNTWRGNFGAGAGSGLGGTSAVPEPAGFALLLVGLMQFAVRRRK